MNGSGARRDPDRLDHVLDSRAGTDAHPLDVAADPRLRVLFESPPHRRAPHSVQFYEKEGFLYEVVADFLADGLESGEPVVVIATAAYRGAFAERLSKRGFALDDASAAGRLTFVDAADALSRFMRGSMPDEEKFLAEIGGLIERSVGPDRTRVRMYGEMVDLLWRSGQSQAAVRVEELWNDLSARYPFSLLCAYPIGNFFKETDAPLFESICDTHRQVFPAEGFPRSADAEKQAREISLLQQRAATLEAEIAHRKELEKALRDALAARQRAERELSDTFENATIGLHWVGPEGTILRANEAELKLLGYSREEYVGRNITDVHADRDAAREMLNRLAAGQETRDFEARLIARDGSIKHVSISSNALFESSEFVHTRCFTRDITDRKRLEEQNAFLLDATTVLIGSLDYETRLTELANLAVPRLADWCGVDVVREDGTYYRAGLAQTDPEPTGVAQRVAAVCRPDSPDPVARVIESGEPKLYADVSRDDLSSFSGEQQYLEYLRALGVQSCLIVPMKLADRTLGAITLVAAESGRHYSRSDLPLATELARRAAIAIENARLYQLAQQSNRAKDEFLATLSHELRTPLTAILGWARMLTLGGLDAETVRTAVETIERSARTQATLIDDLLDLSKIVTGNVTLRTELVDLGSVIESAVQTLQLAADAKNIAIDVVVPSERLVVKGDPTRLQQIVWNLLSNSIKFSDAGQTVRVRLERSRGDAHVTVSDDGRGITADFLPHVFEPFRQADAASTRSQGGLGLGLAIVKHIAELHGGRVTASSAGSGRGATFVATLPLALQRSSEVRAAQSPENVDLRGMSVLLVDDDADTRVVGQRDPSPMRR
jgi:PAS domain S-box-containing protein